MAEKLSNLWWLIRHGKWELHWWPDSAWAAHMIWYDGPIFGIRAWRVSVAAHHYTSPDAGDSPT